MGAGASKAARRLPTKAPTSTAASAPGAAEAAMRAAQAAAAEQAASDSAAERAGAQARTIEYGRTQERGGMGKAPFSGEKDDRESREEEGRVGERGRLARRRRDQEGRSSARNRRRARLHLRSKRPELIAEILKDGMDPQFMANLSRMGQVAVPEPAIQIVSRAHFPPFPPTPYRQAL